MKFIVDNRKLLIEYDENENSINSGSIKDYLVDVEFSDEWDGLTKVAKICIDGENTGIERAVIDGQVYIDMEEHAKYAIGFIGYTIENNVKIYQKSTDLKKLTYKKGAGEIRAENLETPTPSQWEIYMTQIQEFIDNGNQVINEANNLDVDCDGETLTLTKKDGTEKTVNVKGNRGEKGDDGYTPVKGTDYYTDQEKTEMQSSVISSITPTLDFKQNKADNALQTINKTIVNAINEINSIAKGANQTLSFDNYSDMVTAFNSFPNNVYNVGQSIMIKTLGVLDLWISSIKTTSSTYTYTTDNAFMGELTTNGVVKVGYYELSQLETQKVDLRDYAKTEDVPTQLSQLSSDSTHRTVTDVEKQTWDGKGTYNKPVGGIPKVDLASDVQTSLEKADTAIQEHQDISGKVDKTSFTYDSSTETLTITINQGV